MEKCQLIVYHSRFWRGFRRKMSEFLPGAMEGYIQNLKIHTEGDKLKFSWYSGLSHSLIHITHFFLSRCGLGKGMKYTPFCSLSGYRDYRYPKQLHLLTMFIFFYTENINPPLDFYNLPPPCRLQWSCPS